MPNQPIAFLYRRDWADNDSDDEYDQVMDGFFGSSEPEKKPDGKCGEPPKKAPACPEPSKPKAKPEAKKPCPCKPKSKPKKSKSLCKKIIKKAKSSACKKPKAKSARKIKQSRCGGTPRSGNPFIIFFLSMLAKQKTKRVTDVAREAGKQWCCMDSKSKEMYQKLAKEERDRRKRERAGSRKRKC